MKHLKLNYFQISLVVLILNLGFIFSGYGQDTVCATVRIEIEQELTFVRQAFEARMTINNTLPDTALESLAVTIHFLDENNESKAATTDPDLSNTPAFFFIRPDTNNPTSIAAGSSEKLTWLIIPTRNAPGPNPSGTLYFVGAEVSYTAGGESETITVTPDYIYVKPLPELKLDYFVPGDVYSDMPSTPILEPPVEFPLGVRVKNVGDGAAQNLKIESGQPRIVENDLNIPIRFFIRSSEVNGQASEPKLLVDFGTILPGSAGVAQWNMVSSHTGQFTEFDADFTHSDELGGEVTSVIDGSIDTHKLIRNVLVDLPGRDKVKDFLAIEDVAGTGAMLVYESDGGNNQAIANRFESLSLSGPDGNGEYQVTSGSANANGFFYIKTSDPLNGTKIVDRVVRSDGKIINAANAWFSREQVTAGTTFNYYFNLFDFNQNSAPTSYSYRLIFRDPSEFNRPPVLGALANRIVSVGTPISMEVSATDPDGSVPGLETGSIPFGAVFNKNLDGTGTFIWTPQASNPTQLGDFSVQFIASDGFLTDERTIQITVTDGSLLEEWKEQNWPGETDPNVIGNSVDFDGDGLSNLYEYALGLDPKESSLHLKPKIGKELDGGKHYLTLTYTKRLDDPLLTIEALGTSDVRTDVGSWDVITNSVSVSQDEVPPGFERVKIRDTVALEDSATGRFMRLRVSLGP